MSFFFGSLDRAVLIFSVRRAGFWCFFCAISVRCAIRVRRGAIFKIAPNSTRISGNSSGISGNSPEISQDSREFAAIFPIRVEIAPFRRGNLSGISGNSRNVGRFKEIRGPAFDSSAVFSCFSRGASDISDPPVARFGRRIQPPKYERHQLRKEANFLPHGYDIQPNGRGVGTYGVRAMTIAPAERRPTRGAVSHLVVSFGVKRETTFFVLK